MRLTHHKVLFLALIAIAGGDSAAQQNQASQVIGQVEGVYKRRFQNIAAGPGAPEPGVPVHYESEDIVEVVRYDESHIYLRVKANFMNNNDCSMWGIARYENGEFVYRETKEAGTSGSACTLRVSFDERNLNITDTVDGLSSCSLHCGSRASLNSFAVSRNSKRSIRYLDRLLQSAEYSEAVEEFTASNGRSKPDARSAK